MTCTGASNCPAGQHIHGCYADFGSCDNPADHWATLRDAAQVVPTDVAQDPTSARGDLRAVPDA